MADIFIFLFSFYAIFRIYLIFLAYKTPNDNKFLVSWKDNPVLKKNINICFSSIRGELI